MRCKVDDLRRVPDENRQFFDYLGMDDVEIDEEGHFSLSGEVGRHMVNPGGTMHAGVIFTLCDNAAAISLGRKGWRSVTMCSDMSFYHPVKPGEHLCARVFEQKLGKRTAVLRIEVRNQDAELVAEGIFHMHRVLPHAAETSAENG